MAQYVMSHGTNIFRNHITTTFDESISTGSQRQIDRGTGRTTETNHIFQFLQIIFLRITGSKYNINNVAFNLLIQIYLTNNFTCFNNLLSFQNRLHIEFIAIDILADNHFFFFHLRIVDNHFQHETVHLGFRQRISTFLLNRILCSKYKERFGQRECFRTNSYLTFLHRFQQSTLYLGRSTVNFICQNEVGKNRSFLYLECFVFLTVNHCTDNVSRQQIGSKLYTTVLCIDQ